MEYSSLYSVIALTCNGSRNKGIGALLSRSLAGRVSDRATLFDGRLCPFPDSWLQHPMPSLDIDCNRADDPLPRDAGSRSFAWF